MDLGEAELNSRYVSQTSSSYPTIVVHLLWSLHAVLGVLPSHETLCQPPPIPPSASWATSNYVFSHVVDLRYSANTCLDLHFPARRWRYPTLIMNGNKHQQNPSPVKSSRPISMKCLRLYFYTLLSVSPTVPEHHPSGTPCPSLGPFSGFFTSTVDLLASRSKPSALRKYFVLLGASGLYHPSLHSCCINYITPGEFSPRDGRAHFAPVLAWTFSWSSG